MVNYRESAFELCLSFCKRWLFSVMSHMTTVWNSLLEVETQTEWRLCDSSQLFWKPPGSSYCLCKLHRRKHLSETGATFSSFMMTLMKLSWKPPCRSAPRCCFSSWCFSMAVFSAEIQALGWQLLPSFPESSPSVSCSLRSRVWLSLCSFPSLCGSTSLGRLVSKLLGAAQLCAGPRSHTESENVCVWGRRAENRMPIGNWQNASCWRKLFLNPCLSHCTDTTVPSPRLFVKVLVSASVIRFHTRVHNTAKLVELKRRRWIQFTAKGWKRPSNDSQPAVEVGFYWFF